MQAALAWRIYESYISLQVTQVGSSLLIFTELYYQESADQLRVVSFYLIRII